jgi:hypothetical protein
VRAGLQEGSARLRRKAARAGALESGRPMLNLLVLHRTDDANCGWYTDTRQSRPPRELRHSDSAALTIMPSIKITSIAALVPLLASCASSGLYTMSDEWCATHLSASAARCLPDQDRVARTERGRDANDAVGGNN